MKGLRCSTACHKESKVDPNGNKRYIGFFYGDYIVRDMCYRLECARKHSLTVEKSHHYYVASKLSKKIYYWKIFNSFMGKKRIVLQKNKKEGANILKAFKIKEMVPRDLLYYTVKYHYLALSQLVLEPIHILKILTVHFS